MSYAPFSMQAPMAVVCDAWLESVDRSRRVEEEIAARGGVRHLVQFSGGLGSWATGKRVVERHGSEGVYLLFADVKMEDPDLYRFVLEGAANIGAQLVIISEGRNPWELFRDQHCIGTSKVDLCSSKLKRDLLDKRRNKHCDPEMTTIHVGIDWTEEHRLRNARKACAPWKYESYLTEPPYITKDDVRRWLAAEGIELPALYKQGFPHNNCGGFCIKAGRAQFRLLLRTHPERYKWHEEQEQSVRALQSSPGVQQGHVMYKDENGTRRRITLKEFRESEERSERDQGDEFDWGGCGCALATIDAPQDQDSNTR